MPFSGDIYYLTDAIVMDGQTLAADVVKGDFVYYDVLTAEWTKAGPDTRVGQGIVSDAITGQITLRGKVSGLTNYGLNAGKSIYSSLAAISTCNANISFTNVGVGVDTINDSLPAGSPGFIVAGFKVGMKVTVISDSGLNDGIYTINNVAAGAITVDEVLTTENAAAAGKVTVKHCGLTTDPASNIRVGFSPSATELYIDIDVENAEIFAIQPKAGYFGGGGTGVPISLTDKLIFAVDVTSAQPSANLSVAREVFSTCNNLFNGYFAGGWAVPILKVTDKLVFAVDVTSAQVSADLSAARFLVGACNSSYYGYFGGGYEAARVNKIDRLNFATDTTIGPITPVLSSACYGAGGVNSSNNGYFCGGNVAPNNSVATVDKIAFATEVITTPGAPLVLSAIRENVIPCNSPYAGYLGGGIRTGVGNVDIIDRLLFATDTILPLGAVLSSSRRSGGGCNTLVNGYFSGGYALASSLITDKISFATETCAPQSSANLSVAKHNTSGCQSGCL